MGRDQGERTPPPDLLAAQFVIGDLDESLVPTLASWWIVDGHDGPGVVALAGLSGNDVLEVRESLPSALAELGVEVPSFATAWRTVATDWAAACLDGRLDEFHLVAGVERIYIGSGDDNEVLAEPLGSTYGVDDEHIGGWGRTDAELRAFVRSACEDQVHLGQR